MLIRDMGKRVLVATFAILIALSAGIFVKVFVPDIEIALVLLPISIIFGLFFQRQSLKKQYLKSYIVFLFLLILIPQGLAELLKPQISSVICSTLNRTSVRELKNVAAGEAVELCGYVRECERTMIGPNSHTWEICLISDAFDPNTTVLLFNFDVTKNSESQNVFRGLHDSDDWVFGMSLMELEKDLVIIPVIVLSDLEELHCPVSRFCEFFSPVAQVYSYDEPSIE